MSQPTAAPRATLRTNTSPERSEGRLLSSRQHALDALQVSDAPAGLPSSAPLARDGDVIDFFNGNAVTVNSHTGVSPWTRRSLE